ncbi:BamA/TamA family outer membrane protein [bacterium]|nr:BamA/TamA family outer membrane protein [bacterium]
MICGSRARHASEALVAGWLVLALAGVVGAQALAEEGTWPPRLTVVGDDSPALAARLQADRAWLASQPSWRLAAPDSTSGETLLSWVRRAARGRPAGLDTATVGGLRPVRGHRSLLAELRDRWLARGHLDASVSLADTSRTDPRIAIDPGPRYVWGELTVGGDPFPQRAALLETWLPRPGDAFDLRRYHEAAEAIVAGCAELGHPFPTWLTQDVTRDPASGTVAVTASLLPGPRAVVGPQSTNLPEGRGARFLVRAAGVRSGARFRESDLARGVERLLARDLYARVDPPLVHLTTARDTVGIQWRVEPYDRRNRVAIVLGLSRKDDGGTRLSGEVDIDLPNLAGTGRRLSARWSDDGQERSRFGFSYLEPLILGTPLDTDITLDSEVVDDGYNRFRFDNRWRLSVVALWGVEVGIGWDRSTYPTGDLERTSRTRGRVAILHGRGDRSRSGWSADLAIETASRSSTLRAEEDDEGDDAATSDLGRQETQRLLEADVAGEVWLSPTMSLAARASFRQIDADTRPVPLPEQYRFGGASTLRGYREDEFRGETAAWGGVEWRLGRFQRSRVYTFVDVGYFEFSVRDPESDAVTTTDGTELGFGLGLRTASAPGQIDLAVGFPGSVSFETAKLHVSLVGSF